MNDWNTIPGKRAIILAVFDRLKRHPEDMPLILDYGTARDFVAKWGQTEIPADVRVFCLPPGDKLKGGDGSDTQKGLGGSLILEIPPDEPMGEKEILTYACTYSVWATGEEPK